MTWPDVIACASFLLGLLLGSAFERRLWRPRIERVTREQKRIDARQTDLARRLEENRALADRASRQADQALAYVAQHRGELQ